MKTKILGMCALLSAMIQITAANAESKNPKGPTAWFCKAECYDVGQDRLNFAGKIWTNLYFQKQNAFEELKDFCGSDGVLLVHRFKRFSSTLQTEQHIDRISDYEERYSRYGVRMIRQHDHTVRYETVNSVVREEIEVLPATPENACEIHSIWSQPSINLGKKSTQDSLNLQYLTKKVRIART